MANEEQSRLFFRRVLIPGAAVVLAVLIVGIVFAVQDRHERLLMADLERTQPELRALGDQVAIVVERYDRVRIARTIRRVHQEDICQALGLPSTKKYQADGGRGIREIADLLTTVSTAPVQDTNTFIRAIALNWLVAGTDAHSKNYTLLLSSDSRVRLAPLYDLASPLPYPGMRPIGVKLAMNIGGEYRLRNIAARQRRKLATEVRRNPEELLTTLRATAEAMPDHVLNIQQLVKQDGLVHPIVDRSLPKLL